MRQPYHPIACDLHDELQLRVLRGRRVEVRWTDDAGEARCREGRLADVFSRDGAEYLRIAGEGDVRLDRLVSVDGIVFARARC